MAEFKRSSGEHPSEWVVTNEPDEIAKYRRLVEDGTGWQEIAEQAPAPDSGGKIQPLPAKSAPKPEWVAAAVIRGFSLEDAEKATKEQLIELLTPTAETPVAIT